MHWMAGLSVCLAAANHAHSNSDCAHAVPVEHCAAGGQSGVEHSEWGAVLMANPAHSICSLAVLACVHVHVEALQKAETHDPTHDSLMVPAVGLAAAAQPLPASQGSST